MPDKTVPLSDDAQSPDFEAELPLPLGDQPNSNHKDSIQPAQSGDAALDLIRKKLADSYAQEPDLVQEEKEVEQLEPSQNASKHQRFLEDLARSGKPLPTAQADWHEYYAGLTDDDKKQVWQEFYETHEKSSSYTQSQAAAKHEQLHPAAFRPVSRRKEKLAKVFEEAKRQAVGTARAAKQISPKQGLRSLGFGLSIGALVMLVFLFGFFNERFIAPFIQPSRAAISTSIISGGPVSKSPELIIPKINLEVPVVYDVSTTADGPVQAGLDRGVVHYADTALPGQDGNIVIVGHSSDNIFNPGKYKFAFVLLNRLASGDTFYIQKDGKRYVYEIYKREVVSPTDTSVLGLQDQPATASLITCDPPGTSARRLVVIGKQISPAIASNKPAASQNKAAIESQTIPGNAPSLWSRLSNWLTH